MEKEILKTIKYFSQFSYAPSFEEIYTFLAVKTTKRKLQEALNKLAIKNSSRLRLTRTTISQNKISKIRWYLKFLSLFSQIKLVGFSGTIAMSNARKKDDIDLFIICAKGRLWTARLICMGLASLFGLRRKRGEKRVQDKICLNLFFEESNLCVPDFKKTFYVAHEVLQMKPVINKDQIYERFLKANGWVYKFFPNALHCNNYKHMVFMARSSSFWGALATPESDFKDRTGFWMRSLRSLTRMTQNKSTTLNFITKKIEWFVKKIQMYVINKHKTNEIINNTQLWFFPEDFEKKIKP